ncbi:hypothetical protein [Dyella sp. GSA-30]|jgi:hypothetical protein|uniref:hypothetical protein n=1 Tax=Dyella sp. GSA-30 TaxID=2994496 RepID=UPI0024932572|nr:hypothetical protein [Dyella sp. GSA-30]BDU22355.1 hypothetical protein DYGSA30_38120 [Dyella sp. GSA-30]
MSTEESQVQLLTEIRDIQREHLELYRKNSEVAIAKQEQALNITRRFQRFYRVVVVILFLVIAIAMFWLFK